MNRRVGATSHPSPLVKTMSFVETHSGASTTSIFPGPCAPVRGMAERGTRYEPMIRAKLHSGSPGDLTYLALIESGTSPRYSARRPWDVRGN